MSKRIYNQDGKARLPLFLFLMGTLAFSLSTLPRGTADNGHFMVTSLSSEFASDCTAMGRSMSSGADGGHCTISPVSRSGDLAHVRANVDVKWRTDLGSRDSNGNVVTSEGWATTVEILCDGEECPEDIGRTITIPNHVRKKDFDSIVSTVMSDFNTGAKQMASRIKNARAEAEKQRLAEEEHKRCEYSDKKGHNGRRRALKGIEQMNCFYANMNKMDDEEASDYYERYVLGKLEKLVSSTDVRSQRQGLAMIKSLEISGIGGEFIKESVSDLQKFGQFQAQATQEKMRIMAMNPMDPNYRPSIARMQMAQIQADTYFRSRGINVQNQDWPIGNQFGFDYAQNMLNNLTSFQNQLDQNYAALLQQHQNLLSWNPQAPNIPNYQPQVMNNGPVQPWQQGTQFGPPPPPPVQNQQQAQMQNQPVQPQFNGQPAPNMALQSNRAVISRGIQKR